MWVFVCTWCVYVFRVLCARWQRRIGYLIFIRHFPQKSSILTGFLAERDLQYKTSYAFSPPYFTPFSPSCSPLRQTIFFVISFPEKWAKNELHRHGKRGGSTGLYYEDKTGVYVCLFSYIWISFMCLFSYICVSFYSCSSSCFCFYYQDKTGVFVCVFGVYVCVVCMYVRVMCVCGVYICEPGVYVWCVCMWEWCVCVVSMYMKMVCICGVYVCEIGVYVWCVCMWDWCVCVVSMYVRLLCKCGVYVCETGV